MEHRIQGIKLNDENFKNIIIRIFIIKKKK